MKELDTMISLRDKLNRRFKIVYTLVRVSLVLLWVGFIYILYYLDVVNTLEDALNYSEASLLVIFMMNFITFGSIADLKEFLSVVKIRVENWIWGKNVDLPNVIERTANEITELELSLNEHKSDEVNAQTTTNLLS